MNKKPKKKVIIKNIFFEYLGYFHQERWTTISKYIISFNSWFLSTNILSHIWIGNRILNHMFM